MFVDATPSAPATAIPPVRFSGEHVAWEVAASASVEGLWYFDIERDEVCLSPRALELLGYAEGETLADATYVKRHVHAADIPALQRTVAQIVRAELTRADMELRIITVQGDMRWMLVRLRALRDADRSLTQFAGSLVDIDLRKRTEMQLRDDARRDALTSLPNRVALSERLTARIARAARTPDATFAVLYLDLDRFKQVNDRLGHATGDALLRETVDRIRRVLGPDDLLARVGGDEFVVLLDRVPGETEVLRLADEMHDTMRALVPLTGRDIFTSLSIGVRMCRDGTTKPSNLLRDADAAMYHAKRRGGARTVVYDEDMHRQAVGRVRVQTELAFALRRGELRVAYQPIFDVEERRLRGFEALVRWQHPSRGLLSAGEFVDDVEESGLIVLVGRWMLNEVCEQLAEWRREYPKAMPLSVSINLTDREIVDGDFTSSVETTLEKHGLPAECLVIEMSEAAMTANAEHAIPALRRLRALGVQIQMDGFGRGYTSLSVLRRMPLSAIKIDRSYIAGVATDEESRAMVSTINAFARALGLDVVAEGVESQEQAAALVEMGHFRSVQGNHFGKPAGHAVARELLVGV